MTKSELVRRLAEAKPGLRHHDAEAIVDVFFEQIAAALSRGDRVELRGFGAFAVKHRGPRAGRNPRNGASVAVPDKHVPFSGLANWCAPGSICRIRPTSPLWWSRDCAGRPAADLREADDRVRTVGVHATLFMRLQRGAMNRPDRGF